MYRVEVAGPRRNAGSFFILSSSFQPFVSKQALNSHTHVARSELSSNFPGIIVDMFCVFSLQSHRCHQICYAQSKHATRVFARTDVFVISFLFLSSYYLQGGLSSMLFTKRSIIRPKRPVKQVIFSSVDIYYQSCYFSIRREISRRLEKARVSPIFKSGSRDERDNYRPIIISSTISKIFACSSLLRTTNNWLVN